MKLFESLFRYENEEEIKRRLFKVASRKGLFGWLFLRGLRLRVLNARLDALKRLSPMG